MATSVEEAVAGANRVGYPVLVRPSYVLGGRAMVIAYDDAAVQSYMSTAIEYSQERPVLIDHFLEDATAEPPALPSPRKTEDAVAAPTNSR